MNLSTQAAGPASEGDAVTRTPSGQPSGSNSPGERLRQARLSRKLDLGHVATELRLATETVEAIERDDYQHLPGAVFVGGYIRNYARLLGIDPEPLNADFRRLHPGATAPPRRVARPSSDDKAEDGHLLLYLFTGLVVLALLGGVYAWWAPQQRDPGLAHRDADPNLSPGPAERSPDLASSRSSTQEAARPSASVPSNTAGRVFDASTAEGPNASASSGDSSVSEGRPDNAAASAQSGLTEATPRSGDLLQTAGIERAPLPTPEPPGPRLDAGDDSDTARRTQAAAADTDIDSSPAATDSGPIEPETTEAAAPNEVVLDFSGPCWVDIRGKDGKVLLFGEMSRGDRQALDGEPPFSLVLGNAAAVEMTVGGKPYDVRSIARGNVARFELDPTEAAADAASSSAD